MLGQHRADDLEGVERVAVARRVDLGVEDAKPALVEVAADAREQVRLVGRVDQHLQAFADRRQARAHDRLARCSTWRVQRARVPGDLAGVVAQEVADVERAPTAALVCLDGSAYRLQLRQRLALARLDLGVAVRARAAQRAQRQRGTGPRAACPSRRSTPSGWCRGCRPPSAGTARSGGARCRPRAAKARDHVGIATGPASARCATSSGAARPGTRPARASSRVDAVLAAEARAPRARRARSGRRRGPWRCRGTAPRCTAPRAGRSSAASCEQNGYSCACSGDEEAAQVAQHHQDVLVDRVDVEQVVLHLADDAPEHPQVAAEHAVWFISRNACVMARAAACRICMKVARFTGSRRNFASISVARVVERAQRARRQALDADRLLVDQEGLEDRVRVALGTGRRSRPRACRRARGSAR